MLDLYKEDVNVYETLLLMLSESLAIIKGDKRSVPYVGHRFRTLLFGTPDEVPFEVIGVTPDADAVLVTKKQNSISQMRDTMAKTKARLVISLRQLFIAGCQ